jgi:hypothetical protein
MKGKIWNPKTRERALARLRAGDDAQAISLKLGVPHKTILKWRKVSGEFPDGRTAKAKAKPTASPVNYLAGQLGIIAKLIREKLPELASFTLTTTDNGKASVEYTVRQTQLVSGTVKL